MIQTPYKETLEGIEAIAILEDEEEFIKTLCCQFDINVQLNTTNLPESVKTMDILCPGCPFLVLFKKRSCNAIIFTQILSVTQLKESFRLKKAI